MRHVVVWGCPRSGTSITFELFSTHRSFRYYFEPGRWVLPDPWYQQKLSEYRHVVKNPFDRPSEQSPGLSCNLPALLDAIPDAHHIWVVRNQFDAVASLLPGMETSSHPPRLPARWSDKPTVDKAAALWRFWNDDGLHTLTSHGVDPTVVRYEDLVLRTEQTVDVLLKATGTTWTEEVDRYVERVSNVPGRGEAEFQYRWHRPHGMHVGRWHEDLTEHDVLTVQNIVGDVPTRFGYDVNPPS